MAKKGRAGKPKPDDARAMIASALSPSSGRPSALLDTRVIYCGDGLEQLRKLPDRCVDLIYIDPPFNSNGNYEVFCGDGLHRLNAPPPRQTRIPRRRP